MPKKIPSVMAAYHFWSRVDNTGECWLWTGSQRDGYGRLLFQGRFKLAHRVAWELTNGPIPDGLYVCHTCDNPPCVRPAHLFVGSQQDNLNDMVAKGRSRRQTHCHNGHPMTDDNIYFRKGKRNSCRVCAKENAKRRYAAWIAAGRTPAEWKGRGGTNGIQEGPGQFPNS